MIKRADVGEKGYVDFDDFFNIITKKFWIKYYINRNLQYRNFKMNEKRPHLFQNFKHIRHN